MKTACFSVACVDCYPQFDQYFAGGNSLNQSMRYRSIGWETSLVGAVGADAQGRFIRKLLVDHGVDVSHLREVDGQTASNRLRVDLDGERFGEPGAWDGGVYASYEMYESDWQYLDQCRLWVTHCNSPDFDATLVRKKADQLLVVDYLGLEDIEVLKRSVSKVDIAFVGGHSGMKEELSLIAREQHCLIVLTLGADGSVAFYDDKIYEQEALRVRKVVDTTGCGDAFQAAFSASFFDHGSVPCALIEGAMLGAETAGHLGANKRGSFTRLRQQSW